MFEDLQTVNTISVQSKRPLTWLYSSAFLARRCLFAAVTVYLLEYPNLQIIINLVLSLLYVAILLNQRQLYTDPKQKFTEIFCECVYICGLALLQQLLYTEDEAAREKIQDMFLACIILIFLSNLVHVVLKFKINRDAANHTVKI